MTYSIMVTLPGGLPSDDGLEKEARIRPLTGDDQLTLAETRGTLLPVQRTTELLDRCIIAIGPHVGDGGRMAHLLSAGDRETLVLHIRRLTLGEDVRCTIRCPKAECRELMDVQFRIQDMLVDPHRTPPPSHEELVRVGGKGHRFNFRLPNGADMEEAAEIAARDLEAAVLRVVENCTEDVDSPGPLDTSLAALAVDAFNDFVSRNDPQADVRLNTSCPSCSSRISVPLDAGNLFLTELEAMAGDLLKEVQVLAEWFHWSERDILSMTPGRRRAYVQKISESIGGGERM